MNTADTQVPGKPSAAVRAEAAAWIARLHGPQRSTQLEEGLRRWLAENPDNARAFERMTEAWEAATAASGEAGKFPRVTAWRGSFVERSWARAAGVLLACAAALAIYAWWGGSVYSTNIGEQRSVRLDDGSRISLNSASRIAVEYGELRRHVRLERGEAFFEVAPDANRPFVVSAGDRRVTALGTSFTVRYEPDRFAVMLIDGAVAVSDPAAAHAAVQLKLEPGQRLSVAAAGAPQLDTPRLETVTAWRRGEVVLDKTKLTDAIAEMNRYDRAQLVIDDARIAGLLVSGVYSTGDSAGFARAVAAVYGIDVRQQDGRIHLSMQ